MKSTIYSVVSKGKGESFPCKDLTHAKDLLAFFPRNQYFIKVEEKHIVH